MKINKVKILEDKAIEMLKQDDIDYEFVEYLIGQYEDFYYLSPTFD